MIDQKRLFELFKIVYDNNEITANESLLRDILICAEQVELQLEITMNDEQALAVLKHAQIAASTGKASEDLKKLDEEIKEIVIIIVKSVLNNRLANQIKEAAAILPRGFLEEVLNGL